jgi:hypothetical protein
MNEETLKQIIEIYQQKTFDLFNKNVALEAQILYLQKQILHLQKEENEDDF